MQIEIEKSVAPIIAQQMNYGIKLDREKLYSYAAKMQMAAKTARMELKAYPLGGLKEGETITPKKNRIVKKYIPLKQIPPKLMCKEGLSINKKTFRFNKPKPEELKPFPYRTINIEFSKNAPYTRLIPCEIVNLEARERVIKTYMANNPKFIPITLTESAEPSLSSEAIKNELSDNPYGRLNSMFELFKTYYEASKRYTLLLGGDNSFIKFMDENDRIHPCVDPDGTVTHRMITSNPNVTQIPREMRDLIIAEKDKEILSIDASSLELVILGYYLISFDDGAFAAKVDNEDIHAHNQAILGLQSREEAKRFIYSLIYGANYKKIGWDMFNYQKFPMPEEWRLEIIKDLDRNSITKYGKKYTKISKEGYILYDDYGKLIMAAMYGKWLTYSFHKETKGFTSLLARLSLRNSFKTLDGREVNIDKSYTALNMLLQTGGAVMMKYLLWKCDEVLKANFEYKKDYALIAVFHDEFIYEVNPDKKERITQLLQETFERESLNLLKANYGYSANYQSKIKPLHSKIKA